MENLKPNEIMEQLLETLEDNECKVVKLFYGIKDGSAHTFEEIAGVLNTSVEDAETLHGLAIRKLRHPSRSHKVSSDEFISAVSEYKGYKELAEVIAGKR